MQIKNFGGNKNHDPFALSAVLQLHFREHDLFYRCIVNQRIVYGV